MIIMWQMSELVASREDDAMKVDCFGEPLPMGAVLRLGTIRLRHGVVNAVAFGPKGDFLVSGGSSDSEIRVWGTATGKEIVAFPTHNGATDGLGRQVFAVSVSSDGDTVAGASGLEDCRIHLYSLDTRKRVGELRAKGMEGVKYLAFSADGKLLACAGQAGETFVWDMARQKVMSKVPSGRSQGIGFTPDSSILVVSDQDRQVHLYDVGTGKRSRTIKYDSAIESMDVSPDGRLVACLLLGRKAERRNVVLSSVSEGKCVRALSCGSDLYHVRFTPDSKVLVADGNFWDCATGRLIRRLDGCGVSVPAFSRDGKILASGLELWDVATGTILHRFAAHEYDVGAIGFLPDGRLLTAGPIDKTFRLWDGASGQQLQKIEPEDGPPARAFSPDGKRLAGGYSTQLIRFFDGTTGKEYARVTQGEDKKRTIEQMAFSPDGRMLALATQGILSSPTEKGVAITLVDAINGKTVRTLQGHENSVRCVAFHPAGKSLASGSSDKTIRIWDIESGRELKRLEGHEAPVTTVAVSPDAKRVASGSMDDSIRLWDLATGKEMGQLSGAEPACIAFSPDSRILAWTNSSNDSTIHFVDVASRKEIHQIKGHRGTVKCLSFSADGKLLASGSEDTTGLVWDISGIRSANHG